MTDELLMLGIIAAMGAGDAEAIEALLVALAKTNPRLADEVHKAMLRGLGIRNARAAAEAAAAAGQ